MNQTYLTAEEISAHKIKADFIALCKKENVPVPRQIFSAKVKDLNDTHFMDNCMEDAFPPFFEQMFKMVGDRRKAIDNRLATAPRIKCEVLGHTNQSTDLWMVGWDRQAKTLEVQFRDQSPEDTSFSLSFAKIKNLHLYWFIQEKNVVGETLVNIWFTGKELLTLGTGRKPKA